MRLFLEGDVCWSRLLSRTVVQKCCSDAGTCRLWSGLCKAAGDAIETCSWPEQYHLRFQVRGLYDWLLSDLTIGDPLICQRIWPLESIILGYILWYIVSACRIWPSSFLSCVNPSKRFLRPGAAVVKGRWSVIRELSPRKALSTFAYLTENLGQIYNNPQACTLKTLFLEY